ncbi:PAS domain-containing sensor histidine kinase [Kiritimatiella glycovorans]|uniref:histidine kinase n=1 Tax=Kiritimatiella glycovorans TaxID=1307763 RepID=A0A0G3EHC2_9BACT|nr:PAS domain-containing sensor histidine kinase [Kiritimatiella glycovorans]AKJ64235.1 Sensor protein FixL [Kiritimatiella glycovorans]
MSIDRATSSGKSGLRFGLRIAVVYVLFGTLWILLSDRAALLALPAPEALTTLQTFKGILFVLISGAIVFGFARREWKHQWRLEELRRESAERLELALRGADLGLWDWNLRTGEVYFDERWQGMLGFEPGSLAPNVETWRARVHPDDLGRVQKALDDHIENRTAQYETEHRMRTRDGDWIWILDRGRVTERAQDGTALRMTGTHMDITPRRRAEAGRRLLEAAIEQAAEAVMITDADGVIEYVNPAFEDITGYKPDEAVGGKPAMLRSGRQDDAFYEHLWDTLRAGEVWRGRFSNRRQDGSLCEEEAVISPVRDETGTISNFVAVQRDITEEKTLETQLVQAQKLETIGTMASGVAHEINNPLTAIINYATLLREKEGHQPGGERLQYAAEIERETRRLSRIVRNLLVFARQSRPDRGAVRVSDVVQATRSLLETTLRHDRIELDTDIPGDLPEVICNSQQVQQILMNLVINARDALNSSPPEGKAKRIVIRAGVAENDSARWLRMEVEDNGPGLSEADADRIFEPFYSTKGPEEGTGLGLAISRRIAADHGGMLEAAAMDRGGAKFSLVLPLNGASAR